MQYDVVWFTPENKARAIELYARLDDEERLARGISWANCCRVRKPVFIPDAEGKPTGLVGCAFIVARYGTIAFDDVRPSTQLFITEIEPGLSAGTFKPEVWGSREFQDARNHELVCEKAAVDARERDANEILARRTEAAKVALVMAAERIAELAQVNEMRPRSIWQRLKFVLFPQKAKKRKIERIVKRLHEGMEDGRCQICAAVAVLCNQAFEVGLNPPTMTDEQREDPEFRAEMVRANLQPSRKSA